MPGATVKGWNTGSQSSLFSVGTHRLYLSASGQDRKQGEPVVLLMQGLGTTIDEWVLVKRYVEKFARWVEYDRSGMGKSEGFPVPPEKITAVEVANELDTLLHNAQIAGPYIIICHSWGGMTSREFLHLRRKDIVGMVFIDPCTEHSMWLSYPPPYVTAVDVEGSGFLSITNISGSRKLSDDDWEAIMRDQGGPRHQRTESAEWKGMKEGAPSIIGKKQLENHILGNHPVSVLRSNTPKDLSIMMEAGIAAGNGTEEDRRQYKEMVDKWGPRDHVGQSALIRLSNVGRYSYTPDNCHNVHLTEPQLVVDEIKWVWDRVAV